MTESYRASYTLRKNNRVERLMQAPVKHHVFTFDVEILIQFHLLSTGVVQAMTGLDGSRSC